MTKPNKISPKLVLTLLSIAVIVITTSIYCVQTRWIAESTKAQAQKNTGDITNHVLITDKRLQSLQTGMILIGTEVVGDDFRNQILIEQLTE